MAISYHYWPHNNPEERGSQTQNTLMEMALLCVGIKLRILSSIPEGDSAISFIMKMKLQPSGTVYTVQKQLFVRSPGHMSKIKAVAHVTTSDFCKRKPHHDPKYAAFWDVIPWSLVKKKCWHFRGPCCLITTENTPPICPDDGCRRLLCNVTHYTSNRLHSITSQNRVLLEPRTS